MTSSDSKLNWKTDPLGLQRTYQWVMQWSHHPHGTKALGFISAIEAIFFPIPVDPLLVAMGVGDPKKALKFAFVASFWSVMGGILGYFLGLFFWVHTQDLFYEYVFSPTKMDFVLEKFQENAFIAIFLASFTPIPFKVFTVAAGVAQLSWLPFLSGAILGRGLRFFILGGLIYKFGAPIRTFIEQHFRNLTIGLGLVAILAFVFYKFFV